MFILNDITSVMFRLRVQTVIISTFPSARSNKLKVITEYYANHDNCNLFHPITSSSETRANWGVVHNEKTKWKEIIVWRIPLFRITVVKNPKIITPNIL